MVRRHLRARPLHAAAFAILFAGPMLPASAQSPLPGGLPPPPGMPMPVYARHRFPQAVRVGDLIGEVVQRPVESQSREGTIRSIVREEDGTLAAIVRYGGLFGFGGRDIAVPLDAMALLGQVTEIVGFSPKQLAHFPTVPAAGENALPKDAIVLVGLAKPSH